jgi:hypothetical protein
MRRPQPIEKSHPTQVTPTEVTMTDSSVRTEKRIQEEVPGLVPVPLENTMDVTTTEGTEETATTSITIDSVVATATDEMIPEESFPDLAPVGHAMDVATALRCDPISLQCDPILLIRYNAKNDTFYCITESQFDKQDAELVQYEREQHWGKFGALQRKSSELCDIHHEYLHRSKTKGCVDVSLRKIRHGKTGKDGFVWAGENHFGSDATCTDFDKKGQT